MNKGLKKIWDMGKLSVNGLIEQMGVAWDEVLGDLKELRADYESRLEELLDEWVENEKAYELFDGFLKVSEKGWDASVAYLRKKHAGMQDYLGKQARLTPHLVGGIDGFLRVYLATPADRWARSPRYKKGVKVGRLLGVICAVTVFLPVSLGRAAISMLPGASRVARYLAKRWEAARRKREAAAGEGSASAQG